MMISKLVVGHEKALLGGIAAGVLALLGQLGVNGQMTVKEAVYALVAWVGTHGIVYLSTNTDKPLATPSVEPTGPVPQIIPEDPAQ